MISEVSESVLKICLKKIVKNLAYKKWFVIVVQKLKATYSEKDPLQFLIIYL